MGLRIRHKRKKVDAGPVDGSGLRFRSLQQFRSKLENHGPFETYLICIVSYLTFFLYKHIIFPYKKIRGQLWCSTKCDDLTGCGFDPHARR